MLTLNLFQGHEGQEFVLESGDGHALDVTLTEVESLRPCEAQARQGFSLIFESASSSHWPQGNYRVRHPELGSHLMLLVPLGPGRDSKCMRYQAVFN